NRLYVTCFRGNKEIEKDAESALIWERLFKEKRIEAKQVDFPEKNGMQQGRIFFYNETKNWWSRSGIPFNMPVGEPGGPDSEIFYDTQTNKHENSKWKNLPCHLNCDCGRFIEIANSVFMEFKKTENGFEKLKQKNVDFGGGLERIALAVQKKDNIFETDLFLNIIEKIERLSGKKYRENTKAFEIIADHLKAVCFIVSENIVPSNLQQGYIVRRLIRRAIRCARILSIKKELFDIIPIICENYKDIYPELKNNLEFIEKETAKEYVKFEQTLEKGLKEFEKISGNISGSQAFNLYQSYGFPIEMTQELAQEKGKSVDLKEYKEKLKKHQNISRASSQSFKGGLADTSEKTTRLHTAAHLMLAGLRKILGDHVSQKGSNITAERLRFDFSHSEKLTEQEIKQVEDFVNQAIKKQKPIIMKEMSLDEAKNIGAIGIFQYGEKVKVYSVEGFSCEICGGPHVQNTKELGNFKIIKQESSSAGIRRIKAILEDE
ncbi:MAG: alanine--tRNA ligase, partial [Candidatus Pacebacteria bacterium]|nr:alanine--tRNA ligase [Candidatus Paceibacterota bacterium]